MSDGEKARAEYVAQHVVARVLDMVQDPEVAERVISVWGGEIDKTIGRGLRRALFYLFLALMGIAAMKFGLPEKLLKAMGP